MAMEQRRCPKCGHEMSQERLLSLLGWELDERAHTLGMFRVFEVLPLTKQQTEIMSALFRASGRVVPLETLYMMTYGARPECDQPDPKILDVQICKIRRKALIKRWSDPIRTVWGGGRQLVRAIYRDMSPKSEPYGAHTGSAA